MSVKQIIRNAFPRGVKALYREYWGNGNAKKYHVNEGKVQIQLPNSVYPNNVNIENYVRIQDHVRLIAGKGSLVIKNIQPSAVELLLFQELTSLQSVCRSIYRIWVLMI